MPTLRSVNNPNTDSVVLSIIKQIITPGTLISTDNVYIQNKYIMSLGSFPAIHLSSGAQHYRRNSLSTYMGSLEVSVEYYGRWDASPETIDGIRADIAADLERVKSNLEDQDSLEYGGSNYCISIPEFSLSSYKGEFDSTFPGMTLIYRVLTATVNLLPYDTL